MKRSSAGADETDLIVIEDDDSAIALQPPLKKKVPRQPPTQEEVIFELQQKLYDRQQAYQGACTLAQQAQAGLRDAQQQIARDKERIAELTRRLARYEPVEQMQQAEWWMAYRQQRPEPLAWLPMISPGRAPLGPAYYHSHQRQNQQQQPQQPQMTLQHLLDSAMTTAMQQPALIEIDGDGDLVPTNAALMEGEREMATPTTIDDDCTDVTPVRGGFRGLREQAKKAYEEAERNYDATEYKNLFVPLLKGSAMSICYSKACDRLGALFHKDDKTWLKGSCRAALKDEVLHCRRCKHAMRRESVLLHFFSGTHASKMRNCSASVSLSSFEYWLHKLESIPPPGAVVETSGETAAAPDADDDDDHVVEVCIQEITLEEA